MSSACIPFIDLTLSPPSKRQRTADAPPPPFFLLNNLALWRILIAIDLEWARLSRTCKAFAKAFDEATVKACVRPHFVVTVTPLPFTTAGTAIEYSVSRRCNNGGDPRMWWFANIFTESGESGIRACSTENEFRRRDFSRSAYIRYFPNDTEDVYFEVSARNGCQARHYGVARRMGPEFISHAPVVANRRLQEAGLHRLMRNRAESSRFSVVFAALKHQYRRSQMVVDEDEIWELFRTRLDAGALE